MCAKRRHLYFSFSCSSVVGARLFPAVQAVLRRAGWGGGIREREAFPGIVHESPGFEAMQRVYTPALFSGKSEKLDGATLVRAVCL